MTLKLKVRRGKPLILDHLGCCRLTALLDAIEIVGKKASARGIPYNKIPWDKGGELRAYVIQEGNNIYNATYAGKD